MRYLSVRGAAPLRGELTVQSAKNSVLPILAATLLSGESCRIRRCPRLSDVENAAAILRHLGASVIWDGGDLVIDTAAAERFDIPEDMMRAMRSSVIFLGAILARCGRAALSYPGGCELGPRPIDLHLSALRALGAEIDEQGGELHCRARQLHGGEIVLSFPSVGATENAILCACGARGTTVITNAAREPEIRDLQDFLVKMGARVYGAGSSTVTVEGAGPLHGCEHRCIGDRIAAATYLCAAAATGGEITLHGVEHRHLITVTDALRQAGCAIRCGEESVTLSAPGELQAIPNVRTSPYPGFPTDAQAVLMAAMLRSRGTTVFVENIFESRFRHVPELLRMGADIRTEGRIAVVWGGRPLRGAAVRCTDLRGGAALVIAALQAQGESRIESIHHIARGYQDLAGDLTALGAYIHPMEENTGS